MKCGKIEKYLFFLLPAGLLFFVASFFLSSKPGSLSQNYLYFIIIPLVLTLCFSAKSIVTTLYNDGFFMAGALVLIVLCLPVFWTENFGIPLLLYALRRAFTILTLLISVYLIVRRQPRVVYIIPYLTVTLSTFVALLALWRYNTDYGFLSGVRLMPLKGSFVTLGQFNNSIRIGWIWGAASLFSLWIFLNEKKLEKTWASLVPILIIFPQLLLMIITYSRGPLLALMVSVLVLFSFNYDRLLLQKKVLLFVGITFAAAFVGLLLATGVDSFVIAMQGLGEKLWERGLSLRLEVWQAVFQETGDHYFLGQGLKPDTKFVVASGFVYDHSHNFLIDIYRYCGIAGVFVMASYLIYALKISLKKNKQIQLWGILLFYGCLCLLTNGKYPLADVSEFWFVFWLPIAFITVLRTMEDNDAVLLH
ncbi:MAG: O-antigen ligase family protein [Desulfobulbaceae bacterium]|nr:O-antigen ligase family protein [Desulfobulbaceae bacterium]